MKVYKKLILGTVLGLSILACKPDMDLVNPNEPTTASYYKTEAEVIAAVNGAYNILQRNGGWGRWMAYATNVKGDDWVHTYKASGLPEMLPIATNTPTSSTTLVLEVWKDWYITMYAANLALEVIPGSEASDAMKDRLMGEAYFLRGLSYYYLGQFFGEEIPVNTHTPRNIDDYYPLSAAPGVLYAQMISDLENAVRLLPVRSVMYANPENIGRATKGSAQGLIAKAYMNRFIFEKGTNSEWQKAADVLNDLISSNEYSLVEIYRDNHTEYNENNSESVFEVQFFNNDEGAYNASEGEDFIADWGQSNQSTWRQQEMGMVDGFGGSWWNAQPNELAFNQYEDGDPRKYYSIWWNEGAFYQLANGRLVRPRQAGMYGCRKYCADYATPDWDTGINERVIRYSDILLMYAECLVELNRASEAIPFINQVRARANNQMTDPGFADEGKFYTLAPAELPMIEELIAQAPEINGVVINTMRRAIKHERLVELMGEGHRFLDLLRWHHNPNDPDRNSVLDNIYKKANDHPEIAPFDLARHMYMPISGEDLSRNPNQKPNSAN